MSEIALHLLVGRMVWTREGDRFGRIEEIRANDQAEVLEFVVGEGGLLERLSILGLFSIAKKGHVVRWDQINLDDVRRPSLTCDRNEIRRL